MTTPPTKKSREQRYIERQERKALYESLRVRGDNRGWEITSSAGMPTWQWVDGGKMQPKVSRFIQSDQILKRSKPISAFGFQATLAD